MKNHYTLVLVILLLLGCRKDTNLTFESVELTGDSCSDCPNVKIILPKAVEKSQLSETIDNALKEEVISILSFEEEQEINSIRKAIKSFTNNYQDLKTKFPDESIGWEAKVNAEVVFENLEVLTIRLEAYTFTGGAHGYSAIGFLNFDKQKAEELENWELFEDEESFTKYAETKFRLQEDIPQDSGINTTGFMFESDAFHLPQNIGYTEEGLELIYNQYEVASYADGSIRLVIPFVEANKYLKRQVVE